MMPGNLDKKKMEAVQQISSNVDGEITISYPNNTITIKLTPKDEKSQEFVKKLMPQFSDTLATQLHAFFKISGRIVEIKDKKKKK